MNLFKTLLVSVALITTVICAAGKLDGTPIHYGSLLRIKASLTGYLYNKVNAVYIHMN
jgi:hypothetical protein